MLIHALPARILNWISVMLMAAVLIAASAPFVTAAQQPGLAPAAVAAPKKSMVVKPKLQEPKPPENTAPPTGDVRIRTNQLTVTGTGALPVREAFPPLRIRTGSMMITGTGALPVREFFSPLRIKTTGMTITGTGGLGR
ncbi:MAG: hypothetical protein EPN25_14830 [Nitrospirae bacterium]|nr:MAG: hypothetical protein EPN25_14830 [Nitrospirota bacterium]